MKTRVAALWHFLLAAFVFSDFFLRSKILVSSPDILNFQWPLWELARRQVAAGELSLWNPYPLNGVSIFSQGLTPVFFPENWLLFLLPESFFFWGVTLLSFVKLWVMGFVSYLWFKVELKHRGWALFASTTFQLSGFAIWAVTNANELSLACYVTVTLYLIWTLSRRAAWKNYCLLTIVGSQLFYCANLSYEVYAVVLVALLAIYRNWKSPKNNLLVAWSFGTCLLLAMPRWLPSWYEIQLSSRYSQQFVGVFNELGILLSRLFVPEVFGVSYWASLNTLKNVSSLFEQWNIQVHSHFPQYFGVAPALLVFAGWLTGSFAGRARFWGVLTFLTLAVLVAIQPFDTAFRGLTFPLFHQQSLQLWLPFGFSLFAAFVGRALQKDPSPLLRRQGTIQILALAVLLYVGTIWTFSFQTEAPLHWGWKAALPILLLGGLALRFPLLVVLVGICVVVFSSSQNSFHASHLRELGISLAALGLVGSVPANFLLGAILVLGVVSGVGKEVFQLSSLSQSLGLAGLGALKFALVSVLFWRTFRDNRRRLLPVLGLILALDLIPAAKIHTHMGMNPFWRGYSPFPPVRSFVSFGTDFDLKNFRFNFPNTFLSPPIYRALYGRQEFHSSIFMAYEIRSYAGVTNTVSRDYDRFLRALLPGYPENFREMGQRGLVGDIQNERFLDLTGVRYDFRPDQGLFRERHSAIPRFALFSAFEVIPNENDVLERLKDPTLSVQHRLLLSRNPGVLPEEGSRFLVLSAGKGNEVSTPSGGLLYFGDSFHPGWTATVNGKPAEVLRANHSFMAVAVPPGQATVKFTFIPPFFSLGKRLALAGGATFLATLAFLMMPLTRVGTKARIPVPTATPQSSR